MHRLRWCELFELLVLVVSASWRLRHRQRTRCPPISAPTTTATTPTAPAASSLTIRGRVIGTVLGACVIGCFAIGHSGQLTNVGKLAVADSDGLFAVGAT